MYFFLRICISIYHTGFIEVLKQLYFVNIWMFPHNQSQYRQRRHLVSPSIMTADHSAICIHYK